MTMRRGHGFRGLSGIFSALLAYTCCWGSGSAFAETGTAAQRSDNALEEIIVTAEKREERISDVGMSITAKSREDLAARGIESISDFSKIEPSFTYGKSNSGTPTYTIRGIGYNDYALAAPPAVSVYTDEVPFAYSSMTRGVVMDLVRVEVLKGPQGTLFGQNSTGGAINFIAAKPTSAPEAGTEISYGRFNAVNVSGFVSGPIAPTFLVRAAIDVEEGGAWQQNYTRNETLGDQRVERGRLTGEWLPDDKLTALISLNGWLDRSNTQAGQLTGFVNPGLIAATVPALLASPPAPQDARATNWVPGLDPKADESFYQTSLRVHYEFTPAVQLTSISAYSGYHTGSVYDIGGVTLENEALNSDGHIHSFYQELRLSGKALDSRLDWLAGVNFASDRSTDTQDVNVSQSTASYAFAFAGGPRWTSVENTSNSNVTTKAAFVNSAYHFSDQLSAHAGARFTDSRDSFNGCTHDPGNGLFAAGMNALQGFLKSFPPGSFLPYVPAQPGACTTLSNATLTPARVFSNLNEHNVSWSTGLDWKPSEGTLLYASVTKGYKAGAFPTEAAIFEGALTPVTQESVLAYETGFKTEWFDKSLQLDGAYFHYDYKNKQLNGSLVTPVGVLFALINVPVSAVDGFELSSQWHPVTGLTFNASATYLDSRVTKDFFNTNTLGSTIDFKGEAFPFTPKWATVVGAKYQWPVSSNLEAYTAADYSYRSSTQFAFGELDFERIKAYGLLDLRGGVSSADSSWFAELWGRNVTNTYYWTVATAIQDTEFRLAGMPVTYGVRFGYHYR